MYVCFSLSLSSKSIKSKITSCKLLHVVCSAVCCYTSVCCTAHPCCVLCPGVPCCYIAVLICVVFNRVVLVWWCLLMGVCVSCVCVLLSVHSCGRRLVPLVDSALWVRSVGCFELVSKRFITNIMFVSAHFCIAVGLAFFAFEVSALVCFIVCVCLCMPVCVLARSLVEHGHALATNRHKRTYNTQRVVQCQMLASQLQPSFCLAINMLSNDNHVFGEFVLPKSN